jgi:hypothetical protein
VQLPRHVLARGHLMRAVLDGTAFHVGFVTHGRDSTVGPAREQRSDEAPRDGGREPNSDGFIYELPVPLVGRYMVVSPDPRGQPASSV